MKSTNFFLKMIKNKFLDLYKNILLDLDAIKGKEYPIFLELNNEIEKMLKVIKN